MQRLLDRLPPLLLAAAVLGLWLYGPLPQWAHYHDFADQRNWLGVAHAADVLSNLGFAIVGAWGIYRLWPARRAPELARGRFGYGLFLVSLMLTAAGSSFYHLHPDNSRLVWDRLPIALACAGLLAAVYAESKPAVDGRTLAVLLAFAAVLSVAWWYVTEQGGQGDLRPYLLLQAAPLVLIPLWQAIDGAPRAERVAFGLAIGLYVAAKVAEVRDHEVLAATGWISGHTLKHLLASGGAAVLVGRLIGRIRYAPAAQPEQRPAARAVTNSYGMFGTWH